MSILGDLDQYTKLQSADALRDAAKKSERRRRQRASASAWAQRWRVARWRRAPHRSSPAPSGPPPIPQDAWYYVVAGERRGPVDLVALRREMTGGVVTPESLVWKQGMSAWTRLAEVAELR